MACFECVWIFVRLTALLFSICEGPTTMMSEGTRNIIDAMKSRGIRKVIGCMSGRLQYSLQNACICLDVKRM